MAETRSQCWEGTKTPFDLLDQAGCQVSQKKAQICQTEVRYLGFVIKERRRSLGLERKQVINRTSQPTTKMQVREILGAVGFCQIWIPGFSQIANQEPYCESPQIKVQPPSNLSAGEPRPSQI